MRRIILRRALLHEIIDHARECRPDEACGLVAGKGAEAARVLKLSNSDSSPVSYVMDSGEQLSAMRDIEDSGLDLLAIYHSHPSSPAYPSGVDVSRAFFPGTVEQNFPGVLYIIVGLLNEKPEVRAFDINDKGVFEAAIEVRD